MKEGRAPLLGDPVREALAELVSCRDTRGNLGKAGGVVLQKRWHSAWAAARAALAAQPEEPRTDLNARYWIENRSAIIDCLARNGYELLSSSSGWTLHKLPAPQGPNSDAGAK